MNTHTLQYYRQKENEVFRTIPGMNELLHADEDRIDKVKARYPDAVFALMTAEDLFRGDSERNAINQDAYFSILNGEDIPSVRRRYAKATDRYLRDHIWDD